MITEITEGKLFFDFTIDGSLERDVLRACREAVEYEIERLDPWCDGNNVRNRWVQLYDVPSDHGEMHEYLQRKIKKISWLTIKVEEPPAPITYCYSGDSRICYHPHTVLLNDCDWVVKAEGEEMKMLLVLTYNTKCFPIPMSSSAAEGVA